MTIEESGEMAGMLSAKHSKQYHPGVFTYPETYIVDRCITTRCGKCGKLTFVLWCPGEDITKLVDEAIADYADDALSIFFKFGMEKP